MSKPDNPELTALNLEKHILIRKEGRGEITKQEFQLQFEELDKRIYNLTHQIVDEELALRQKKDEEENRRIESMPEDVKKETVKRVRGPKKDSYASLILEVLQKKSIKTIDAAADAVVEKKPGRDRAKVRAQIVVMINEIKKGKKPAYTWDESNFQLNTKA